MVKTKPTTVDWSKIDQPFIDVQMMDDISFYRGKAVVRTPWLLKRHSIKQSPTWFRESTFAGHIGFIQSLDELTVILVPTIEVEGLRMPRALVATSRQIERSKRILDISSNESDDAPYSFDTWHRAISTVVQLATGYLRQAKHAPPPPAISDGPNGSIDIVWRTGTRQLLINCSSDSSKPMTVSGVDGDEPNRRVRDRLTGGGERQSWLLAWLTA